MLLNVATSTLSPLGLVHPAGKPGNHIGLQKWRKKRRKLTLISSGVQWNLMQHLACLRNILQLLRLDTCPVTPLVFWFQSCTVCSSGFGWPSPDQHWQAGIATSWPQKSQQLHRILTAYIAKHWKQTVCQGKGTECWTLTARLDTVFSAACMVPEKHPGEKSIEQCSKKYVPGWTRPHVKFESVTQSSKIPTDATPALEHFAASKDLCSILFRGFFGSFLANLDHHQTFATEIAKKKQGTALMIYLSNHQNTLVCLKWGNLIFRLWRQPNPTAPQSSASHWRLAAGALERKLQTAAEPFPYPRRTLYPQWNLRKKAWNSSSPQSFSWREPSREMQVKLWHGLTCCF